MNWLEGKIPLILIGFTLFLLILYIFSVRSRSKLNKLANYDPLTGEMNLNRFKIEAQKLMDKHDKKYAVVVIDVDKFKLVNDLYGYEFGDKMLIIIAKSLRQFVGNNELLCHGTADRFDLFLEFKDEADFKKVFDRCIKYISNIISQNMSNTTVLLSAGVCILEPDDTNIITVIDHANTARKLVKGYHESTYAFYDKSMYADLNRVREIELEMTRALQNEEFIVYVQPKVQLSDMKLAGGEALVRWQHPQKGLMPPGDFIPIFEQDGFIVNLDFYVLEKVCQMLENWKRDGRELITISVNLSRRHLFYKDTVQRLYAIVSKYDVDPCLIEVELTESAFDNCNIANMNTLFDSLHACGFTVSVDDFGAGYSSLSLLKDLPIDVLKIDKSFLDCHIGCEVGKIGILLESVISLSNRLNIKTLTEGVETKQQVALLLQLGCNMVQGFFFAKPMPMKDLERLIDSGELLKSVDINQLI